jgi:NAD-dependent SIR2 family protein deacetylase
VLKPNVTLFGEALPTGAYSKAIGRVVMSPICLVVGSSLEVFPANTVPGFVKYRWGTLAVNNLDGSGTAGAHIVLTGKATETLTALLRCVKKLRAAR